MYITVIKSWAFALLTSFSKKKHSVNYNQACFMKKLIRLFAIVLAAFCLWSARPPTSVYTYSPGIETTMITEASPPSDPPMVLYTPPQNAILRDEDDLILVPLSKQLVISGNAASGGLAG